MLFATILQKSELIIQGLYLFFFFQKGKIIDQIWLVKDFHGAYEDNTLKFQPVNNKDKKKMASSFIMSHDG